MDDYLQVCLHLAPSGSVYVRGPLVMSSHIFKRIDVLL
jgi:hypothetical protein